MKPTVVLLHSGGMSSRQWRKLSDALHESYHVIAPDFLGSGENPAWPADATFTFNDDVIVIEKLIASVGAPVHLIGHSYGGFIATMLALRTPTQLRSLVAYDPVSFGVLYDANDRAGLADLARVGEAPLFTDRERGGSAEWFEMFVDFWNGPGAWQRLVPGAQQAFLRVGRKVFFEVMSLLNDRTPIAAYDVIDAPALFMMGAHSPVAAQRTVAWLSQALPHGHSKTFADAGHMGPLTNTAAVNAAILEFLATAPSYV